MFSIAPVVSFEAFYCGYSTEISSMCVEVFASLDRVIASSHFSRISV